MTWTRTDPHCEREPVTMRSRKLSPHEPSPMTAISIRRRWSGKSAWPEVTTVLWPYGTESRRVDRTWRRSIVTQRGRPWRPANG